MNARRRGGPPRPAAGFSLLELVVALAIFAVMAAAAYASLASIARTRGALAAEQQRLAQVQRALGVFTAALRQAVGRDVRGNDGRLLPAMLGGSDRIEFTRVGYANPLAEPRSNLQRVAFALANGSLQEARHPALDRAPSVSPLLRELLPQAGSLRLRYLGCDRAWREHWPPAEALPCQREAAPLAQLPRAVELRIAPPDFGELRRIVELPEPAPCRARWDGQPC
ncbi:MAG: type II secretion system protein GspJ [Xanthomonadales bacterium]|nr:type II secretion system protein GspJ [Xanthomonadales bacterium]MCC6595316.1 type II secretion system minor pseudopilin GspJ [Rhodanobacteraceae bacterium]MDL1870526.1 type II secretion system protein GspJ [Gammaproteobacteria bacterium PRO6]